MNSNELIDTALRVLSAIDHDRQPAEGDLQILTSQAEPEEVALSADQLAAEIIQREISRRRTLRAKH